MAAVEAEQEREPGVFVAAVMPPELKQQLVTLAHRNERTLSGELRAAVREHLAREQEQRL